MAVLSKMLASFFATFIVDGGFGHGVQHHYLQVSGSTQPTTQVVVINEQLPSFGADKVKTVTERR